MGEIILSFVIGSCLVFSGIVLIVATSRESKKELERMANNPPEPSETPPES